MAKSETSRLAARLHHLARQINPRKSDDPDGGLLSWIKTISPFASAVAIAVLGWVFTAQYNAHQLRIAEIEQVDKFKEFLTSGISDKQELALTTIMSFDDQELAVRLVQTVSATQRSTLLNFLTVSAIQTDDRKLVKLIANTGYYWELAPPYTNRQAQVELATRWRRLDILQILLNQGRGVFLTDALMFAARDGWTDGIRLLAPKLKSQSLSIDLGDASFHTPLMIAAREGHADAVDALLEAGADPQAVANDGETPLGLAVDCKSRADPTLQPEQFKLSDMAGARIAAALLDHGAKIATFEPSKNNELQIAERAQCVETFKILYQRDGRGRPEIPDLFVESARDSVDVMAFLLSVGVPPDQRGHNGGTPLTNILDDPRALRLLLAQGAYPNRMGYGTPLVEIIAGQDGLIGNAGIPLRGASGASFKKIDQDIDNFYVENYLAMLRLMLSYRANPNLHGKSEVGTPDETPFQAAARSSIRTLDYRAWIQSLAMMLDAGALPDLSTDYVSSALTIVAGFCARDATEALLNASSRADESAADRIKSFRAAQSAVADRIDALRDPSVDDHETIALTDCTSTQQYLRLPDTIQLVLLQGNYHRPKGNSRSFWSRLFGKPVSKVLGQP